jgi:hypothetical protein
MCDPPWWSHINFEAIAPRPAWSSIGRKQNSMITLSSWTTKLRYAVVRGELTHRDFFVANALTTGNFDYKTGEQIRRVSGYVLGQESGLSPSDAEESLARLVSTGWLTVVPGSGESRRPDGQYPVWLHRLAEPKGDLRTPTASTPAVAAGVDAWAEKPDPWAPTNTPAVSVYEDEEPPF